MALTPGRSSPAALVSRIPGAVYRRDADGLSLGGEPSEQKPMPSFSPKPSTGPKTPSMADGLKALDRFPWQSQQIELLCLRDRPGGTGRLRSESRPGVVGCEKLLKLCVSAKIFGWP